MFVKNKKDDEVKSMYMSAPYPFVSMDNFKKFKEQFEIDLDAVIDIGDLNGKIILDAGCGTGEKACILAEYAKKVVGIDFSGESIKLAQKNSFILDRKNTLFFEDSLLDLKNIKDDELFDVILCSGVLHHLSDPYLGFRNIIKHLKPQGILILSLYHPLGLMEYNIKYKLVSLLAGDNPDKRFKVAVRLFYRKYIAGDKNLRSKIFDTYVHPQINFFSVNYINKNWFIKNNLVLKKIHSKYSVLSFNMFNVKKYLSLKLFLIDLWFGIRRKGFVYTSSVKM